MQEFDTRLGNSLVFHYNIDANGNHTTVKIDETKQISPLHYTIQLSQNPDDSKVFKVIDKNKNELHRVYNMDEINAESYYLNAEKGQVYFDSSKGAENVIISYDGQGYELIGASRVYDETDCIGNTIKQTLQDIINKGRDYIKAIELLGGAIPVITRLENDIADGMELYANLENDIEIAVPLQASLHKDIQDANTFRIQFNKDVAEGKELYPKLHNDIAEGKALDTTLNTSMNNAKESINLIRSSGNPHFDILASDWITNTDTSSTLGYMKDITHNLETQNIVINAFDITTGMEIFPNVKRIDNNTLRFFNDNNTDGIKVILSARYYDGGSDIGDEVKGARKTFETIGKRFDDIDSHLEESTKFNNQADFVDIIKNRVSYNNLTFRKISNTRFNVYADNDNKHVTYDFIKDVNDDFFKINKCFIGDISDLQKYGSSIPVLTGTWVTSAPPQYYTTQIGATFTTTCYGSTLKFYHHSDNRGGIWSITIDSGTPITISTWNDTTIVELDTIATGLEDNVLHTIVGTFKGNDPEHSPVGGASRGWMYYNTQYVEYAVVQGFITANTEFKTILSEGSNKEMAFLLSVGASSPTFCPDHGTGVAFALSPISITIDSKSINFNNEEINTLRKINSQVEITQYVYITLPEVVGNVAEIKITHFVSKRGSVSWSGQLKALQDLKVGNAYPLMIPLKEGVLDTVVSGIGNKKVNLADESTSFFTEEKNSVYSACCVSSKNKNYIGAGKVNFPYKTMRLAENTSPNTLHFWNRATAPKIYFNAGTSFELLTGQIYSWNSELIIAEIQNIYDYIVV